jgi:hypothetical protein
VDDAVLYLNSQKSFLISSSLVLALTIYLSHYWIESSVESSAVTAKSPTKF